MDSFDIVVVGSGPAGSAAAATAANGQARVAIVDKAEFPRDKLCGGLFTGRSERAMRDIFGLEVTPELFRSSTHMRFSASGRVLADIEDAPAMHLTMRREFDAALHDRALSCGARAFLGQPVTDISTNALTMRDGRKIGFKVLIGADGVNSAVARHLFGRPFDPETIGFGLEIETPIPDSRDDAVEVDFDAAEWGYGWAFPKSRTITVGVGGIASRNADMKVNMARYVRQTGSDAALKYKGQYLPFGDFKPRPGRDHILLAGDAAGLVDPITGEGIALAMESGAAAAEAAIAALSSDPGAAYDNYKMRIAPIHRSLRHARLWRMIMFPEATKGYFNAAFARGSALQRKYLDLLAGELDYPDLQAALIRRLPKLGWRLIKHRLGLRGPVS